MKKTLLLSVFTFGVHAVSAQAQDGLLEGWTGETSLTGSVTTGNTETTDVGLGLKLQKESDVWKHKFNALGDFGRVNGENSRRRFDLGYQIDRDINDRLYVYANADYYNDDFGAFQEGYFVGAGGGYKLVLPEPLSWGIEAGAGFRTQETQDPIAPALLPLSVREDEFALRGFSDFDYKFNENVSLYNDTEILWASSDTSVSYTHLTLPTKA